MSDTLRIALIAEGVTDYEVLYAAVGAILGGRSFSMKLLQPEGSIAFMGKGNAGTLGGGWKGVYRWCLQAAERNDDILIDDPIFLAYDLLLLHLDADVACEDPANWPIGPITELAGILPCEAPCPPAEKTTNALRSILLSWLGATQPPPRAVLCTPSKSTEAWVMAAIFPEDREMARNGWECYPKPEKRLAQQPIRVRFAKTQEDYEAKRTAIQKGWPTVVNRLSEASRFQNDFTTAVQYVDQAT